MNRIYFILPILSILFELFGWIESHSFAYFASLRETSLLIMFRLKLSITFVFVALAVAACARQGQVRYSIATSKTYEASLFRQNCMICHGPEGEGKRTEDGRVIPNIRDGEHKYNTDQQIYNHIANGGNGMVPFRGILSDREIKMLVELVQRDLRQNRLR